jgi:uncharacterized protein YcbK (DUF882 family)
MKPGTTWTLSAIFFITCVFTFQANAGGPRNQDQKKGSATKELFSNGVPLPPPRPAFEKIPNGTPELPGADEITEDERGFYTEQDKEPEADDSYYTADKPADTGPWGEDTDQTGTAGQSGGQSGGQSDGQPGGQSVGQSGGQSGPTGGFGGDGKVKLYHNWTRETLEIEYRGKDGSYAPGAAEKIKHFMRCRLTRKEIDIPIKLIEILDILQDRLGGKKVTVMSGYRSPALNNQLKGAAKRSLHMRGWASDISVEGVSQAALRDKAKALRAGGVGFYPTFVHVDVGSVRYW